MHFREGGRNRRSKSEQGPKIAEHRYTHERDVAWSTGAQRGQRSSTRPFADGRVRWRCAINVHHRCVHVRRKASRMMPTFGRSVQFIGHQVPPPGAWRRSAALLPGARGAQCGPQEESDWGRRDSSTRQRVDPSESSGRSVSIAHGDATNSRLHRGTQA